MKMKKKHYCVYCGELVPLDKPQRAARILLFIITLNADILDQVCLKCRRAAKRAAKQLETEVKNKKKREYDKVKKDRVSFFQEKLKY